MENGPLIYPDKKHIFDISNTRKSTFSMPLHFQHDRAKLLLNNSTTEKQEHHLSLEIPCYSGKKGIYGNISTALYTSRSGGPLCSPLVVHAGTQIGCNSQSQKAAHLMLVSG